jgi:gas vesicle protein
MSVTNASRELKTAVTKLTEAVEDFADMVQVNNSTNTAGVMKDKLTHIKMVLDSLSDDIKLKKNTINQSLEGLGFTRTHN